MILAIDIGGTAVKMGLLTREGRILARREASVCFDGYRTPILTTVLREANAFLREQNARAEGIGVSATGQVDDRLGTVIGTNGAIPGYEGTCFQAALAEAFSVPVHVLNDANAAVLGEAYIGRGRGCRELLMVTLGTGVGGGVISGGRLLRGRRGLAGELGHFSIDRHGIPCTCGNRGCYERYASVSALMDMARSAAADPAEVPDGRAFFRRAAEGDPVLREVLDRWLDQVAAGLIGLGHIFNPELILIGGGVSAQEDLLITPLRERVRRGLMPRFREDVRLEAAALGNDAGMIGALKYWLDREEEA